jgi:hypothetical protein
MKRIERFCIFGLHRCILLFYFFTLTFTIETELLKDAHSATFDIPNGDVSILIEAINTSNSNDEPDTINLANNGSYVLTQINNVTDGTNGLPSITGGLTINGNGATIERSSADGTPPFRIIHVGGEFFVTLNDLIITNGANTNGGGIFNNGLLTLNNVTIIDNFAEN